MIRDFRDKTTGLLYKKEAELELTNKRFEEINSTSYGIFVEEIKETDKKKKVR